MREIKERMADGTIRGNGDTPEERFWFNVRKSNGCWLWAGCTNGRYGNMTIKQRGWKSHRYSYFLHNGKIPKGKEICHKCDNTLCVNPSHLFAATHSENMQDMVGKDRASHGESHTNAKLTGEDVLEIRKSTATYKELARIYNVHDSHICRIKNKERWRRL